MTCTFARKKKLNAYKAYQFNVHATLLKLLINWNISKELYVFRRLYVEEPTCSGSNNWDIRFLFRTINNTISFGKSTKALCLTN